MSCIFCKIIKGEAAGQEVPHCHLHIVPRYKGDSQKIGFKHRMNAPRLELDQLALKISRNIASIF